MRATIDLGQIIQIGVILVAVIGAHYSLKTSLSVFGNRLDNIERQVTDTIRMFTTRLDRHEESIMKVAGELQRLMGRWERRDGLSDRRDES